MDNTLRDILLVGACLFIGMLVFMVVLALFAFRQLQHFLAPDPEKMRQKLDQLRKANAGLSQEALIQKVIQQEALKCGIVGAITGVGGFITLPIALPVDILLSTRIQSAMVQFIAMLYNRTPASSQEQQIQSYLVMTGSVEVSETATKLIMRFVVRLLGKSLSKAIPVIGAVVGFAANYAIAQVTGNLAVRWYASPRTQLPPR